MIVYSNTPHIFSSTPIPYSIFHGISWYFLHFIYSCLPIYHEAGRSNFCTAGYLGCGLISVTGALSTFRMLSVRMSCATIPEAGSCLKFGIFVVKVRRFLWIYCGDG